MVADNRDLATADVAGGNIRDPDVACGHIVLVTQEQELNICRKTGGGMGAYRPAPYVQYVLAHCHVSGK
jgi:hypothetical protein